jgi:Protein of unknown function (DUF664)
MTDKNLLDIALDEPSATADEAEMLFFALARSRATFAWKCGGLDAAALSKPLPPSAMTLGGLLKHLALVEDYYTTRDVTGEPMGPPWRQVDFDADPDWEWHTAAGDSAEALYGLWRGAVERSRAAWAAAMAHGGLDQPAKVNPESGEPRNLRRTLVDLHEEYARHVGHADLLREAIDGLVGEDPPRP